MKTRKVSCSRRTKFVSSKRWFYTICKAFQASAKNLQSFAGFCKDCKGQANLVALFLQRQLQRLLSQAVCIFGTTHRGSQGRVEFEKLLVIHNWICFQPRGPALEGWGRSTVLLEPRECTCRSGQNRLQLFQDTLVLTRDRHFHRRQLVFSEGVPSPAKPQLVTDSSRLGRDQSERVLFETVLHNY